ncbi:lipoprotein [Spiroplasma poulsonii]|uniref:lipoprotein n=1 Tax=Spiroplasma poulsonii TaxID=2138 RepID=UPI001F4CDD96|nr:lipoprotein [Spiroplasma poulsonii]UNF61918.1 lipoprotein [Spiroplasma poulsonii]
MKKILSILGVIGLTTTSTTTLISCEKPNNNENGGNKPTSEPQQPPENSSWKLITDVIDEGNTGKTYIGIFGSKTNWNIIDWKGIEGEGKWHLYQYKSIYRWDGNGKPKIPTINNKTGKITDWK